MKGQEARKKKLLSMLSEKGTLSNAEISEAFGLSPASVRRLCADMAEDGSAIRVRGGLRMTIPQHDLYSFDSQMQTSSAEKVRIAEFACRYIQNGQTVFLESGSTVYQCAIALANKIRSGSLKDVRIVTNSLNNLNVLYQLADVSLIGGHYRPGRRDFVGYLCERFLRSFCFDHTFLGADSIDTSGSVMVMDFDTARIDEALLQHSNMVTIVAHSTKFQKSSLLPFTTLNDVARVITDSNMPEEVFQTFSGFSADLLRV